MTSDLASSPSFPQAEGRSEGTSASGTLKIPPNSETTLVLVGKSPSPYVSYFWPWAAPSLEFIN